MWAQFGIDLAFSAIVLSLALKEPVRAVIGPGLALGFAITTLWHWRVYYSFPRTARAWQDWGFGWHPRPPVQRVALRSAGFPVALVWLRWLPHLALLGAAITALART